MKRSIRIVLGVISSSLIGLTVFQNCSQPGTINVSSSLDNQGLSTPLDLGADSETLTVGLNKVPNLKMFFVVDNSGTMQQNQLNLSDSFGAMFDTSSSESLAKFDATTFITSTAQKSPLYPNDKTSLDQIVNEQKNFSLNMSVSSAQFSSVMRDATYNYGGLPGDNIGYQLTSSANPLQYSFSPAFVLGDVNNQGQITFKNSIRKLASENPSVMESEFKKRIAILNSTRIQLEKVGPITNQVYKPMHSDIIDNESGLCAVARILRNPENYLKAGELASFTIVSDENDNDPQGLNCIQKVTEYTGTEDVVDGECRQRESTISYQTVTPTKSADTCKINGLSGYNFQFTYPSTKVTTDITYKAITTPAKYTAKYSNITYKVVSAAAKYKAAYTDLTYKINQYTYQFLQTNITYYTQSCLDVVSDNGVIGKKCNVIATPITASKDGDLTSDCYGLAKSLNSNAVNDVQYKPVCTTSYRNIASCNTNDVNCKKSTNLIDKKITAIPGSLDSATCQNKAQSYSDFVSGTTAVCTDASKIVAACSVAEQTTGCVLSSSTVYGTNTVYGIIGSFDAAACLAKASSNSDYVSGGTPTCVDAPKIVASCSSAELAAGCSLTNDAVYGTKLVTATGDLTSTPDGCFNYAKTLSGNAVSSITDITLCKKVTATQNLTFNSTLNFSEIPNNVDGGTVLAANSDCGVIKSIALAKAQKSVASIAQTDQCVITAVNKATESIENLASDCTTQANNRCNIQNLRSCSGLLVAGTTSNNTNAPIVFKKSLEDIRCASKCNTSVLNFCVEDNALDITVAQYLKKKFGDTASCIESVKDVAGTAVAQTAVLATQQQNTCKPNIQNIPSYFIATKPPYRTKGIEIDYVAGTVKNQSGNSVPKSSLVDYIKERNQSLANGQMIFSALVRTANDSLGIGGTYGVDYQKLITDTNGQIGSVLSNDYSLILKDLGKVIKSNIERTFVLQKMQVNQIIKNVYQVTKTNDLIKIDNSHWTQNGSTIVFSSTIDLNDGDQFKIDFANY